MGVDMCADMCVDIGVDMCVDMGADMCVDMCVDMCARTATTAMIDEPYVLLYHCIIVLLYIRRYDTYAIFRR